MKFYWGINWAATGGAKGFDLKDGGTSKLTVLLSGDSNNIGISGGSTISTGYGTNPMLVTFSRTNSSQYQFSMVKRDGTGTFTETLSLSDEIDEINFFISDSDGNTNRNLYFIV